MSLWLLRDQVYRVPNTQKNEIQVYYHDNQRVEKKRSSDVSKNVEQKGNWEIKSYVNYIVHTENETNWELLQMNR